MHTYLTVAGVAYLLGSIPFGFLLVLLVRKEDIRAQGSGNIGATNVMRSGAKGLGVLTFLLDTGKGAASVLLAEYLGSEHRRRNAAECRDPGGFLRHGRPCVSRLAALQGG